MPAFPKICKLLINSSMRYVKNEFLTPHLPAFTASGSVKENQK
jgi:hypothetical protein